METELTPEVLQAGVAAWHRNNVGSESARLPYLVVHPTLNDPVGQFIRTIYPKAKVVNGRLILGKRAHNGG